MAIEKDLLFIGDPPLDGLIEKYGNYYGKLYFEKITELKKYEANEYINNSDTRLCLDGNVVFIIQNQELIDRNASVNSKFLVKYNVEVSDIFDASGMKKKEWREAIKDTDYVLVMNAGFCRKEYHNLKTRAGHCAICNPRNLREQQRRCESGYIYVAHSETLDLIKIGACNDPEQRIFTLNNQAYGGFNDWTLEYTAFHSIAYQIESSAHNYLGDYRFDITFERLGITETSREIFDCSVDDAIEAIQAY